jgi:hypothetical protein
MENQQTTVVESRYTSLKSFYPYYLTEHRNLTSRRLHFVGTALLLGLLVAFIITQEWRYFIAVPLVGYGFAWVGHFFFEKNKPATFKYPFFSLASDFIMFWHILTGQIDKKLAEALQKTKNQN